MADEAKSKRLGGGCGIQRKKNRKIGFFLWVFGMFKGFVWGFLKGF